METIDVVQTVISCEEKLLFGKRFKDGFWEFFEGKILEDECLKRSAIREVNEETGLELVEDDLQNFRKSDSYRSSD